LARVADPDFDPWQAIDGHPELHVVFDPVARLMGGGFHVGRGGRAFIVVDPDLDEPRRREVLTHELVHHERGGGAPRRDAPPLLETLVERDELCVDAEVARRLVPPQALARLVDQRLADGQGVDARDVADHFSVSTDVATRALLQLRQRLGRHAVQEA
jgi:IrrE N-terminal-like domain